MSSQRRRMAFGLFAIALGAGLALLFLLALANGYRDAAAGAWFGGHFLAPGFLGFALILGLVGWRLLRAEPAQSAPVALATYAPGSGPATEPDVRPVDVPPEEIELQDGAVVACLRCGSRRLQNMPLGAGFFPEVECRRCLFRGMPMQFDSTTGYRQFVKGLQPESPDLEEEAR